jgi:hypothetical protein
MSCVQRRRSDITGFSVDAAADLYVLGAAGRQLAADGRRGAGPAGCDRAAGGHGGNGVASVLSFPYTFTLCKERILAAILFDFLLIVPFFNKLAQKLPWVQVVE